MGYLTLFSLLLNVWLISSTSMVVPVTLTQYTLHKASPFSITNIQDDWNDNVIILSNNNQTIRQLSKIDNKNFVPALYCDNNVARQAHQITSHYSKHQRYSHLFLANFQYRFTHSRRQLLYLNFRDIYFNYDSDYKDYIDA
ncbi:hypothetical protein VXS05_13340 [Photobacterium toruni]|uniref:Uncharacterized protein n=1 Tax=Photobacterium toruni TaxID=1935446 RepID=A0A1T4LZ34_9GAMM|nr:hypothetical protein [Photobacterium toruni]MEC6816014.1 hypothetical protein [Photobacterium toruni]SJZ59999.1 hypothetical protein CZ814_00423 [Photobacterium toruni]